MPIDATKPEDGVPAAKATLRSNLQAADDGIKAGVSTNANNAITINAASFLGGGAAGTNDRQFIKILCTFAAMVMPTFADDVPAGKVVKLVAYGSSTAMSDTPQVSGGASLVKPASAFYATTQRYEATVYEVDTNTGSKRRLAVGSEAADMSSLGAGAASRQLSSGGLQAPAQAAAAGYTELVFQEEFEDYSGIDMNDDRTAGFNFYRFMPFEEGVLPTGGIVVSNGVLTLTGGPDYNYGLGSTCGTGNDQWIGFDALGGAYFEARIAFDPFVSGPGWPAFWSMASEHLWDVDPHNVPAWIEADFMDKYFEDDTQYITGGHWWVDADPSPIDNAATIFPTVSGYDWEEFHIYGFLWVPGSRWEPYRDNIQTAVLSYSEYPFLANGDSQSWPVILGSHGHPMQVDWVRVWAAP